MSARPKAPAPPGSSLAKLEEWKGAGPGRAVVKSIRRLEGGREHVVACQIDGEIVAIGVGSSPVLAMQDACTKLWEASLSAASGPTNAKPKWSRRRS